MGKKDNTILMVGVGLLAGYLLMPEKVKQVVGGGGSGGGGIMPAFPGWASLIGNLGKLPDFPGWGSLLPEIKIPNFPEVPSFPGWKSLLPDLPGIPDLPDWLPDKIPDWIKIPPEIPSVPTAEDIIEMIEDIIPDFLARPSPPGEKKDEPVQRDIGGKWDYFVSGWQEEQTYPTFFGKTLLDHLTSWFAPTGFAVTTPYAEGVGSEQPTRADSEINHPPYLEGRASREASPTPETPGRGTYTAIVEGKYKEVSLREAIRIGGGT